MKKPKTTIEKPVPKAEQAIAPVVTEAKPKKPKSTQKAPKKSQAVAPKSIPNAKTEQPIAAVVTEEKPKKAQVVAPKPVVATLEMTMPEQVGLTAGSIWHYLAKNGATPASKLVKELTEEEKIIQRSIGWLAKEDKITLDVVDRAETIALKE